MHVNWKPWIYISNIGCMRIDRIQVEMARGKPAGEGVYIDRIQRGLVYYGANNPGNRRGQGVIYNVVYVWRLLEAIGGDVPHTNGKD